MNMDLTELVFILDRSGSMGGLESDTIGGFNGMIDRQKKEEKEVNVTTILFDDEVEVIHDRFPIGIIEPLTEKEYYVRGCTALLDAVGAGIDKMDNVQKHLPEQHRAGKVIFVITTDGLENSSTEYSYEQIRRKIEAKKECGWEFLFLGANIDAGKEAEKIGINRSRSVTYENDSEGIAVNFEAVGRALSKAVTCEDASDFLDDDWKEDIEKYHEESQRKRQKA
ncbi:vWA domain-containing protein [Jutongia sp.]|uniref:vWA domain-containing protein n=1 Tax=Jutongia sp. TaxID=2944204 RepID=UPI0030791254